MQALLTLASAFRRRPLWGYLVGFVAFALALGIRFEVDAILPSGFPYLTFFPAVILTCFLAGGGPGLLTAAASGLAAWYFFIAPVRTFDLTVQSSLALGFYIVIVSIDILLIEVMYRALTRLAIERARSAGLAAQHGILFRELQHRVSNNLQLTGALLELQAERVRDRDAREALSVASRRLALLGQIHRRLRDPGGLTAGGIQDFLRDLCRDLIDTAGAVQIRCDVDAGAVEINADQAIPLGLIVAELVSNALEHAYAGTDQGSIRIGCHPDGSMLELTVADNGRGLPPGFDLSRSESLGLQIVRALTDQLQGTFTLSPHEGTIARLRMPLKTDSR